MSNFGYSEDNIAFINRLPRWEVISNIISERGYRSVAEIGVADGKTALHVLQQCSLDAYFVIDPTWTKPCVKPHPKNPPLDCYQAMVCMRMTSAAAAVYIADKSLDLVFIDAMHNYDCVKSDILNWLPKMKDNAVICGHDYCHYSPGVMSAVSEIFTEFTLIDDCAWDILCDPVVHNAAVWLVELPTKLK